MFYVVVCAFLLREVDKKIIIKISANRVSLQDKK